MLEGLEQRIGMGAVWWFTALAESHSDDVQSSAQALEEMVDRLQSHGRFDLMERSSDRDARQESAQELREERSAEGMSGQDISEEYRKRAAAACALPAIGTVNPLPSDHAVNGPGGAVPMENTVPIQSLGSTTVGTAPLLERKS